MFEDFYKLYERCEKVKNLDKEIDEIVSEWGKLTEKYFSHFPKVEIIRGLKSMWTLLDEDMGRNSQEEQWNIFVSDLGYCSDRMNINRWCRLQLLLGNVQSQVYGKAVNR